MAVQLRSWLHHCTVKFSQLSPFQKKYRGVGYRESEIKTFSDTHETSKNILDIHRSQAYISFTTFTGYCLISTIVNFLVLIVLIFSQNFSTNGPYVVLNFCKVSETTVLFFAKKSYNAGKFTGELKNLHLVMR